MFEIVKQENGKYSLYQLPDMLKKGNIKDQETAEYIKTTMNKDIPDYQLVSLSNQTCSWIDDLLEYYITNGTASLSRSDVIRASIKAFHEKIFVQQSPNSAI